MGINIKNLYTIFFVAFWALIASFASYFHIERTFADGATEIIGILETNGVYPPSLLSFTSPKFLAQLPLLIASNIGVEFKYYSILYSLGYLLPNFVVFFLTLIVYKKPHFAIASMMILIVDINTNFYFIASLAPAFALLFLLAAILEIVTTQSESDNIVVKFFTNTLGGYICLVMGVTHPTLFVLTCITIGFYLFLHKGFKFKLLYIYLAIALLGQIIFFSYLTNDYAKSAMQSANLSFESTVTIIEFLFNAFTITSLCLLGASIFLLVSDRTKAFYLVYFFVSVLLFIGYLNTGIKISERSDIYLNYSYSGFVLIVFLFIFSTFKDALDKVFTFVFLSALSLVSAYKVLPYSNKFTERKEYVLRAVEACKSLGKNKCRLNRRNVPEYANSFDVHFKTESLVISSLLSSDDYVTITPYEHRKVSRGGLLKLSGAFDGNTNYTFLNNAFHSKLAGENFELFVPNRLIKVNGGEVFKTTLYIKNNSETPIYSISYAGKPIKISYHVFKGKDLVTWDGIRTPIEFDVYNINKQPITIKAPEVRGSYTIVVDLVIEGERWLRNTSKFQMEVR